MAKSGSTSGQFTYDFGIAIAQGTVNKVIRLAGVSLTLASAFYSLQQISKEYVSTLKENALRFGGYLATIKTMEQAQDRLLKGLTTFSVEDQLEGMNKLRAAGISVRKEFDFYNKAAHASGKSFNEFASVVNGAVAGNLSGLVDMGLMTERAAKRFQIYQGNTVMMQSAITNFLKSNKTLAQAIKNDFYTIQDQTKRIGENWKFFLQSVIGKPNDSGSFYQQIVGTMKMIADSFARNGKIIKQWGFAIGQILGWVVKQVGYFTVSLGKLAKSLVESVWKTTDNYQQSVYRLLVVLEFWKVHIVNQLKTVFNFLKDNKKEIMSLVKVILIYKTLSMGLGAYRYGVASVRALSRWWMSAIALAGRYRAMTGAGKIASWAAFMPKGLRRAWVFTARTLERSYKNIADYVRVIAKGNWKGLKMLAMLDFKWLLKPFQWLINNFPTLLGFIEKIGGGFMRFLGGIPRILSKIPLLLKSAMIWIPRLLGIVANFGKMLYAVFLGSNPIGWIVAALMAFTILFVKVKAFRDFVFDILKFLWEWWRFIGNIFVWIGLKWAQLGQLIWSGLKALWAWIVKAANWLVEGFFDSMLGKAILWVWDLVDGFFSWVWDGIKTIGGWLKKWIWDPIVAAFTWMWDKISGIGEALKGLVKWFRGVNDAIEENNTKTMNKVGIRGNAPTIGRSDWIDGLNWDDKKKDADKKPFGTTRNPIVVEQKSTDPFKGFGGSLGEKAPVTVSKGAIVINVAKGSNIDEEKLAIRIRKELADLQLRDFNRQGSIMNQTFSI